MDYLIGKRSGYINDYRSHLNASDLELLKPTPRETFTFRFNKGVLQVKSKSATPNMRDAVLSLKEYPDQDKLQKLIDDRMVEVMVKVREKTWQSMGLLTRTLYNSIMR